MKITSLECLPVGNAITIGLSLSPGVDFVQVQRREDDDFDAPTGAFIVFNQPVVPFSRATMAPKLLDTSVANGVEYFYVALGRVNGQWIASEARSATPSSAYQDRSVDAVDLVRNRLVVGLAAEIDAGRLRIATPSIPVWTAPPQVDNTPWPVVTLRLEMDSSVDRYLGEHLDHDHQDDTGDWWSTDGWHSRVTLKVIGWSQNPGERNSLRQALKRLMLGNLPVFIDSGLSQIDFQQQDSEDFESFNAPVYQTVGTLTCLAPTAVASVVPAIEAIDVIGNSMR